MYVVIVKTYEKVIMDDPILVIQERIDTLTQALGEQLLKKNWFLATAESCTGGWVAQAITSISGSSKWFDRGFVTYSNNAKQDMLDVREETLAEFGAVSEQTAKEMAEGALKKSLAHVSIAITGIAGPDGGTLEKPVGTVWFAWSSLSFTTFTQHKLFFGSRALVRAAAVEFSLKKLLDSIS